MSKKNVNASNQAPLSKVTIVEVAKKAGVSLGTVSRVINNDIHVAAETRKRVLAVTQEWGTLPIGRRVVWQAGRPIRSE
ncbi:LacI family DNA-binding transcriptional regulator [Candidatus Villigracilis proximus]|uniref:LacI family DNA-binding transcriptional regulator n=1 Tax=Candidatus Villigracilis proximus TaxID=3140683 RepID=UPI0031EAACDC